MVYPHNGMLLSNKKMWAIGTSINMDKSQTHCARKQKPDSKATFLTSFIWPSGKGKTIGTENRSRVSRN